MPAPLAASPQRYRTAWNAAAVLTIVMAVAAGAQLSFTLPGTAVPQTAQTLAVMAAAGLAGPALGTAAMIVYLLAGGLGVPVFAGGATGFATLAGPTGGFLLGFVPAAALAGLLARRGVSRSDLPRRLSWLLLAMAAGHAVVLICGWARLAATLGALPALQSGVMPFLAGAAVKSAAAALVVAWQGRDRGLGT